MRSRPSDFRCDGRVLALNSYENRVYQIGIEDGDPVVAKFYRPGRWSDAAIREEHAFSAELAAQEIPVVAPLGERRHVAASARGLPLCRVSRGAADVGRNSAPPTSGSGWGDSWAAFMRSAGPLDFHERGAAERCTSSVAKRAISCSTATGCRTTSPTNMRTSPTSCSRRWKRAREAGAARASGASWAIAIAAISCGPTRVRTSWISTIA